MAAREGYRQLATWVPGWQLDGLERLAEVTGRSMAVEVAHALERHLAAPPTVRVETPPLPPVEVAAPPGPRRRRGRKRKEAKQ